MESHRRVVLNFFEERHICLKKAWVDGVFAFLRHKNYGQVNSSTLCNLIYEQWLFSDLRQTSEPSDPQMTDCGSSSILDAPIVLQMKSILDISSSFYSQVKTLTDEFVDNTGFEAIEEEERETFKQAKTQRTLHMVLSNGRDTFEAFEWKPITELSGLTKPGAKVLLLPPVKCRKAQFMLEPFIFQLLGGEVAEDMDTYNPVAVMSEKLGIRPRGARITLSPQRLALAPIQQPSPMRARRYEAAGTENEDRVLNTTLNRSLISGALLDNDDFETLPETIPPDDDDSADELNRVIIEESDSDGGYDRASRIRRSQISYITSTSPIPESPPRRPPASSSTSSSTVRNRTNRLITGFSSTPASRRRRSPSPGLNLDDLNFEDCEDLTRTGRQGRSLLEYALGGDDEFVKTTASSKKMAKVAPIRPQIEVATPSSASMVAKEPKKSMTPVTATLFDPRRRKGKTDIRNFVETRPPQPQPTKAVISTSSPQKKRVKVEVIDLSSDEEIDIKPDISRISLRDTTSSTVGSPQTPAAETSMSTTPEEPQFVKLFKRLAIATLADAQRRARFVLGSFRCTILGVMSDVTEPLRVVDGLWTKKIVVKDTSATEGVACYVDNDTLTHLVGWTPDECERIRSSSDKQRRQEGDRRIKAVDAQFGRLDLVMEIEFFSGNISDPVIRRVTTMMQLLDEMSYLPAI